MAIVATVSVATDEDRVVEGLNPAQVEAVTADDGPNLVVAGAGSGKTRVLTHRIAYLLATERARPGEILAITFTNRAADEMRERLAGLVGDRARQMWVMTFHATCARMLRVGAERLGYSSGFTIYDETDSLRMIKQCMEELGIDPKRFPARAIRSGISAAKNSLIDSEEYASSQGSIFEETVADVYKLLDRRLLESNAMDFDDLLVRTVDLLSLDRDFQERWQRTFHHVLVDEYQDTNRAQYRLLQLLTSRSRNLFCVGDEDQSIYAFRHADIRNILDFEADFPEARSFHLEQNYRSSQNILDAANSVVSRNRERRPKALWTEAERGDPIKVVIAGSEHEEARWVADEIEHLVEEEGRRPSEIAVFYRVNAMSRVLEDILSRNRLSYRVVGGTKFYERSEIKDALAYLTFADNPADSVAFSRIVNSPKRGIGDTSRGRVLSHANTLGLPVGEVVDEPDRIPGLGAAAKKALSGFADLMRGIRREASGDDSVATLLRHLLERSGYTEALAAEDSFESQGRLENLDELVNVATEFDLRLDRDRDSHSGVPLRAFLEQLSLQSAQDDMDSSDEQVTLMTLHNAKGLEFDTVFMIGCEEGVFPHSRALDEGQEEEERRLCYVGLTRAKQRLYVSWARRRQVFGMSGMPGIRSRFIEEIPAELCVQEDLSPVAARDARISGRSQGVWRRPEGSRSESTATATSGTSAPGSHSTPSGPRRQSASATFEPGEVVRHERFGEGEVVGSESGGIVIVRFSTDNTERKLMADYAPLERISTE